MDVSPALITAWARTAVAPQGGAFRHLQTHDLAVPVVHSLLERAGITAQAVDAVVLGNALGAGGNPARMLALAAGLPTPCATYSVDTQCCSGLDAVSLAVGLLASGQASVVLAGGVEAWSRSPLRYHRPSQPGQEAVAYERPAFAPRPEDDPDLLQSAADYAAQQGISRLQQDAYAMQSHARALAHQADLADEIVPLLGLRHDPYPRALNSQRAARMPVAAASPGSDPGQACGVSSLAISGKADGAALLLLATPQACRDLGMAPHAAWVNSVSTGYLPATPLLAAKQATQLLLARSGLHTPARVEALELHDAFAVQGLDFCHAFGMDSSRVNRRGGGLARGHPIAASAAVALVRVLADLKRDESPGAMGLATVAGAGGIGSAALVQRL